MSHEKNPLLIPPRVQENMVWATSSVKGFLTDSPTPIIPNIGVVPTIENLINLHQLISVNKSSMELNLGGGQHRHLVLTMTAREYMAHKGY